MALLLLSGMMALATVGVLIVYAVPILRYHLEQDRTFYFQPQRYQIQVETVLFLVVFALYRMTWLMAIPHEYALLVMLGILLLWSPLARFAFYPYRYTRPWWVRHFERDQPDYKTIQMEGQRLLVSKPVAFQKVIQAKEGWESWVITVTSNTPFKPQSLEYAMMIGNKRLALFIFGCLGLDSYVLLAPDIEYINCWTLFGVLSPAFAYVTWVYAGANLNLQLGVVEAQLALWISIYLAMIISLMMLGDQEVLPYGSLLCGLWMIWVLVSLVAMMSRQGMSDLEMLFSTLALVGFCMESVKVWLFLLLMSFYG